MQLGIVDVGTNSIHLLVGILGFHGKFHVILKERDLTRLGEGGLVRNRLTQASMDRAMEVLGRYAKILKRLDVDHVVAVATSAVREAANGPQFVSAVRRRLGIPLRIISGREEARFIYLGILQAQRLRRSTLILTIGGGSSQVIVGDGKHLRYAASVPLGGARLAQQCVKHDPPRRSELEALRRSVRKGWRPVARAVARHRWAMAMGCSATLASLMMVEYWRTHRQAPKDARRLSISRPALEGLIRRLSGMSASERMQLPGLDPRREDLAIPTAIAAHEWMTACGVRVLRHATGSLREGLVIEYLLTHHHGRRGQRLLSKELWWI